MSVKPVAKPAVARCPKCTSQVNIPASPSALALQSHSPAQSNAPSDFRSAAQEAEDLFGGSPEDRDWFGDPVFPSAGQSTLGTPAAGNMGHHQHKSAMQSNPILRWANSHRWVTAIIALNFIALLSGIFAPSMFFLAILYIPFGMFVIGLLFIPRQHFIERAASTAGATFAKVGASAGGVLLFVVVIVLKTMNKLNNSQNAEVRNADFNFEGIAAFAFVLFILGCCLAVFLVLWRFFGVARVMASGYVCMVLLMMLSSIITGRSSNMFTSHDRVTRGPDLPFDGITEDDMSVEPFRNRSNSKRTTPKRGKSGSVGASRATSKNNTSTTKSDNAGAVSTKIDSKKADTTETGTSDDSSSKKVEANPGIPAVSTSTKQQIPTGFEQVTSETKLVAGTPMKLLRFRKWEDVYAVETNENSVKIRLKGYKPVFDRSYPREKLIISEETLVALSDPDTSARFADHLKVENSGIKTKFGSKEGVLKRSNYPINADIPVGAQIVPDDVTLPKGTKLGACWGRKWYDLTVLGQNDDGSVNIHWDDFSDAWDCSMERGQLIIKSSVLKNLAN